MTMNAQATAPAVGSPIARIDGPLKVTGRATYTADHHFPGMLYAFPVSATIAAGTLKTLDVSRAEAMPGVQAVFTRENIGPLYRASKGSGAMLDERRPPFEDDEIRYFGQYIALIVADSFEQARAAARSVVATYDVRQPDVSMELSPDNEPSVDSERGEAESAFAQGEVTLDQTYTTPPETHNPIELHSTVALFDGTNYTLYETSQAVVNHKAVMVQMLGVAPENVRVITRYLGSGFGGKLWPWTHCVLAAAAARNLRRPVKLEITRQMMFQTVGHRTNTQQRIRLAATREGRLTCLQQDFIYHISRLDNNKENCGEATKYLYSTPNLRVTAAFARRDIGPNTSMRGPGAVPGLYAIESAMNEMAVALDLDPMAFRLLNEPQIDESRNIPFSSRHLKECLQQGAERFGWHQRNPKVGSMQRDGVILGWGMASASWMAKRIPATVSVSLRDDGMAHVSCATQDLGTGTYTVLAQMVAQITELPVDRIRVSLGDTLLPPGPVSGGSMATGSLVPAACDAARNVIKKLLGAVRECVEPLFPGVDPKRLVFSQGRVHLPDQPASGGVPFETVLKRARLSQVSGEGKSGSSDKDKEASQTSTQSFGAHFVEVGWQPEIARLRVNRVVTVIDAGKIINPKTGRNQIEGAIMMGLGMALFEETHYDTRNGAPINSNLADYIVATHADAPEVDVVFLDYPDTVLNELGARGIGEIGLAGFAAAVTDAVHHATGVRVRDLPVQIQDLIGMPH